MVAISPQLPQFNAEIRERHHLPFEVLSDPGNAVADQFGLKFRMPDYLIDIYRTFPLILPERNGDDSWTLPIPARIVVGADGVIRKIDADPDYTSRPEPENTLAFVRSISQSRRAGTTS